LWPHLVRRTTSGSLPGFSVDGLLDDVDAPRGVDQALDGGVVGDRRPPLLQVYAAVL
jgi:hypothetical protein